MIVENGTKADVDGVKMSFGVEQKTTLKDRFLCFIGLHEYSWPFEPGDTLILDAPIPDDAKCIHCGKVHITTGDSANEN